MTRIELDRTGLSCWGLIMAGIPDAVRNRIIDALIDEEGREEPLFPGSSRMVTRSPRQDAWGLGNPYSLRAFLYPFLYPPRVRRVPARLRRQIVEEQSGECDACGESEDYLEIHHVVPFMWKGSDDRENLVALCAACHRFAPFGTEDSDHAELYREYAAKRGIDGVVLECFRRVEGRLAKAAEAAAAWRETPAAIR